MIKWQQWDGTGGNRPHLRLGTDSLFYARQYHTGEGYKGGETNQKITNLKKKVDSSNSELYYKGEAIKSFATEVLYLLSKVRKNFYIASIPTSKCKDDPLYDNRLEKVISLICQSNTYARSIYCLKKKYSTTPLHHGGTRNPDDITNSWDYYPPPVDPSIAHIIFLDDMLTTGATMRAAFDLVTQNSPELKPIGLVWALAVSSLRDISSEL